MVEAWRAWPTSLSMQPTVRIMRDTHCVRDSFFLNNICKRENINSALGQRIIIDGMQVVLNTTNGMEVMYSPALSE